MTGSPRLRRLHVVRQMAWRARRRAWWRWVTSATTSGSTWRSVRFEVAWPLLRSVPGEVDALEALEKVFAKLRQILVREKTSHVEYFSVDLRVASATPIPRP